MENFGLLFGGLGLAGCLAGLAFRFQGYKRNIESQTWIFSAYLALTGLFGGVLIVAGLIDIPSPFDIFWVLVLLGWNPVSVLATFTAPTRWAIFPVCYIGLCALFCLYSVFTCDESIMPTRPFVATIVFGSILLGGSIVALRLSLSSRHR